MNRLLHKIYSVAMLGAVALAGASCTMIEDDMKDCPTGLYVRFVYDYNTVRADLFKDHVGHVTLYVYDEAGNMVARKSVSNSDGDSPLSSYGYSIHFAEGELRPGKYRLQAVAMKKDWDDALGAAGAKYRRTEPDRAEDLTITLDHASTADPATGLHSVEHRGAPLDTLWHTLKVMSYEPTDGTAVPDIHVSKAPYSIYPVEEQYVTVEANRATHSTVSLIRDTKHLNITLRQLELPANVNHSDYEVTITDNNAAVGHDNSLLPGNDLLYTPFASWTTKFSADGVETEDTRSTRDGDGGAEIQRTAHFNVMFNRLMHHDDHDRCATLRIRNVKTGKDVATINLPYILAQGRTAYELYNYSPQEYLDREYDYHLDFILKGDTWAYCEVVINVLSWSKRIQNEEFN